jgi:1-deoxy-D-xylulose-5-phosphate synthase
VGIAEEHATSMAGGLAKQGMTPVLALYSTFLQRSYDQILQDIAMLNLHVVLAVDRAGLVGEDGETHHGVFDIGFLRQAPGMTILCPGSCAELSKMLTWAVNDHNGPVAVRYPRGGDRGFTQSHWTDLDTPVSCHRKGKDMTILTYGTMLDNAMQAADILSQRGIEATVLRLMAVAPLNVDAIASQIAGSHLLIVEEANTHSGIAKELAFRMSEQNHSYKVHALDLGDGYVTHGSLDSLYRHYGLDGVSIAEFIQKEHFYENQKAPGCALDGAPVHGFPS